MKRLIISAILLAVVFGCKAQAQGSAALANSRDSNLTSAASDGFSLKELRAFVALEPIDTHTHVRRVDPAFSAMIEKLNIRLLDIILVDDRNPQEHNLQREKRAAFDFVRSSGGRAVLCTSFDPFKMREPGFTTTAIRELDDDFNHGAIAVKIWKNIGMEIRNADGSYVLPDDSALAPIYKDIASHNKTLVAHVADPDSAWAPPNPASPDYSYYNEHPEWFMYGKPHQASKEQILKARDHILEQNPTLRVVGAHLGSMEADLHQLEQHFDRYPNFAVDTAGRLPYFALQPRGEIIAFILKYQDRLIYGTDLEFGANDRLQSTMKYWGRSYARDWRFLATNETVDYDGIKTPGLSLPDSVLRKIYHDNAVRWFPGILKESH